MPIPASHATKAPLRQVGPQFNHHALPCKQPLQCPCSGTDSEGRVCTAVRTCKFITGLYRPSGRVFSNDSVAGKAMNHHLRCHGRVLICTSATARASLLALQGLFNIYSEDWEARGRVLSPIIHRRDSIYSRGRSLNRARLAGQLEVGRPAAKSMEGGTLVLLEELLDVKRAAV